MDRFLAPSQRRLVHDVIVHQGESCETTPRPTPQEWPSQDCPSASAAANANTARRRFPPKTSDNEWARKDHHPLHPAIQKKDISGAVRFWT